MKKKRSLFSITGFFRSYKNYRHFNKLSIDQRNIVFYAESGQDWHHFHAIIEALLTLSHEVCYVTSDSNDPGLTLHHEYYHSFYIQEGFWQITFFQFLKADCLVLTMLDLHCFQLKRSINPVHYLYLFHAMGSTHMVDFENSYDHYDTILCVGPHQIEEIRAREKMMHLPPKNLVAHGYARIDALMQTARSNFHIPSKPYTILIAPTWGDATILPCCGRELINLLLQAGYRVILRPHYQTCKLTPQVIDDLRAAFSKHPMFSYIDKMGDMQSLYDSDLLICDWSSTSIEYALGLEKPVLYIDVPPRVRNQAYRELGLEPLEIRIRNEVGMVLDPGELTRAPVMIDQLLSDPERFRAKIATFRNTVQFNIGHSVEAGTRAIATIADSTRLQRIQRCNATH